VEFWARILVVLFVVYFLWAASHGGSKILPNVRLKGSVLMSIAISDGIEQFLADYSHLPLPIGSTPASRDLDTDSGPSPGLIALLAGKEPAGASTKPQNFRGIDFLEGVKPAKAFKKYGHLWADGMVIDGTPPEYSIVDAWGNLYHLRLDTDGDGWVENPDPNQAADGQPKLKKRVIVWSAGKDGYEETWEDNPKSWD